MFTVKEMPADIPKGEVSMQWIALRSTGGDHFMLDKIDYQPFAIVVSLICGYMDKCSGVLGYEKFMGVSAVSRPPFSFVLQKLRSERRTVKHWPGRYKGCSEG